MFILYINDLRKYDNTIGKILKHTDKNRTNEIQQQNKNFHYRSRNNI